MTWSKWLEFSTPRRMQLVPANRAMSGKTAFLDDHIGLHRLQTDMCAFRMGRPHPRPTSLSYSTIASFRGETCPGQFKNKPTPPARARHLSGVSVDLLIAVGQIGGV